MSSDKGVVSNSEEKLYERKGKVSRGMDTEDSWVPGTPAKLIPRKQRPHAWNEASTTSKRSYSEDFPVEPVNVKEKGQSSSVACFDANGLLYLKKSVGELPAAGSSALTHEQVATGVPKDLGSSNSENLDSLDLNKGLKCIDAWDPQLNEHLNSSFDIPVPIFQESVHFSTQQDAVVRSTSYLSPPIDSGIDKDTKQPDTQNFSHANSLFSLQRNEVSAIRHLENDTNTTEHCKFQDGQKNAQEEAASPVEVENLNSQPDNVKPGRGGPKRERKWKKHRPKVVVEGKAKKTPKPRKAPKLPRTRASSNENGSSTKRLKSSKKDSASEDF